MRGGRHDHQHYIIARAAGSIVQYELVAVTVAVVGDEHSCKSWSLRLSWVTCVLYARHTHACVSA